jgi:hypothetical protein
LANQIDRHFDRSGLAFSSRSARAVEKSLFDFKFCEISNQQLCPYPLREPQRSRPLGIIFFREARHFPSISSAA